MATARLRQAQQQQAHQLLCHHALAPQERERRRPPATTPPPPSPLEPAYLPVATEGAPIFIDSSHLLHQQQQKVGAAKTSSGTAAVGRDGG